MNIQDHYLEKLHSQMLEIMDEIHRICIQHEIKYFLIGGSLLGAIRHRGYIPWDDDLDIAIPRDDYERFIGVARKELSSPFELVLPEDDSNYYQTYAKVVNTSTIFKETEDCKLGIFVDIFPYDLCGGVSWKLKLSKILYRVFCDMIIRILPFPSPWASTRTSDARM